MLNILTDIADIATEIAHQNRQIKNIVQFFHRSPRNPLLNPESGPRHHLRPERAPSGPAVPSGERTNPASGLHARSALSDRFLFDWHVSVQRPIAGKNAVH